MTLRNNELVEFSEYNFKFSFKNKIGRLIWNVCSLFLFRPFGLSVFNSWRNVVLKIFGAKLGINTIIYSTVKIWAPWNLRIGNNSCVGPNVDCYNQGLITIGDNTLISQKVYLCASTHDYTIRTFPLLLKPIIINNNVWIAAGAFIGPGVNIGERAVVGAKSAVFKDVLDNTVVGGNPSKLIKNRNISKQL